MTYGYESWETPQGQPDQGASWLSGSNFMTRIMGFSFIASLLQSNSSMGSAKLFLLGTIIESGRRFCQWLVERFRFQYSITAQFSEGDPAYEWIILFLTQENLWKRSREFRVTAASSMRKWGVRPNHRIQSQPTKDAIAEYVPTYEAPQLFRWKGYWVEIKRGKGQIHFSPEFGGQPSSTIYLTMYTRQLSAITLLVEDARRRYLETSRPNVVVHTAEQAHFGPVFSWSSTKNKVRRPLSSIILPEGVLDSIVRDAREFLDTADWYVKAGIPHRRGYLLYGPPGTGKTSTIYALAGELRLEIYSLSLASGFVDDSLLQRAVAAIPKDSIFLIEDIDCAFQSREEAEDSLADSAFMSPYPGMVMPGMMSGKGRKSNVTLSGLLNVLDGVGSEEGKLFFATTNFVDHLDPAILRPGRIDRKIQYKLATKPQAIALYNRFYPESHTTLKSNQDLSSTEKISAIQRLAEKFAEGVPEHEFSTAELQGYLLTCKREPEQAVEGVGEWVVEERKEREDRKVREAERKAKTLEARDKRDATQLQGSLARLGIVTPSATVGQLVGPISESTTTMSAPIPSPAALGGGPVAPVPTQPAYLLSVTDVDNNVVPSKPMVNGVTDSTPITPPTTPSNSATQP
ncbi:P-loop containing nucleoside triphosphate hydrolase protein [Phlegmacium glaucopus]|nr:P-loop containing nucleoside triphosphate hydrolase protein [Phlegmacium glaucopus]